jgi:MFS family permease
LLEGSLGNVARWRPAHGEVWVTVAQFGISVGLYLPLLNLLPRSSLNFASKGDAELLLTVTASLGAGVAMVTNVIVGILSDRRQIHHGSRTLWAVVGACGGTIGLVAMGLSKNVALFVLAWMLVQFGVNCVTVVATAFVADRVPSSRRGIVSAWFALAQASALAAGLPAVVFIVRGLTAGYLLVTGIYLVCVIPLVSMPASGMKLDVKLHASSGQVGSLAVTRDFLNVWLLRFSATLANSVAPLFLLFYLAEVAPGVPSGQAEVVVVSSILVLLLPSILFFGKLSDISQVRKPYVGLALVSMAISYVVLASAHQLATVIVFGCLFGLGYGAYLSVDQALTVDVLPNPEQYGRYLGWINIANTAPQLIGPVLGGVVIRSSIGYSGLYMLVAIILTISVLPLRLIRGVS